MSVRQMIVTGDFNDWHAETTSDGWKIITLKRRGDQHVYKIWIKNLYKTNEEILKEEVL